MMLQNRLLSMNDKKRLIMLATQELNQVDLPSKTTDGKNTGTDTENSIEENIHAPKDTAAFLSSFNDPNGFKFLTHDYDPDASMDYDQLMKLVREKFKESTSKYKIPKKLFALMAAFLFGGKNPHGEKRTWLDCDGKFQESNYASKEWIEWAKNNPKSHLLENPSFNKTIQKFRSTIRLVKPALVEIIKRQAAKHADLDIQTKDLEKADFYTYVWVLENGIRRILNDISNRAKNHPQIIISFERQFNDDYSLRIIKICHKGSESSSLDEVVKKFEAGGGAFNEIKKTLIGYCNWSVEALWDGFPKRWNILDDTQSERIEDISKDNVQGFTHILTYFSKS